MQNQRIALTPLLESIIKDNETFKFPSELIEDDLMSMFLSQNEFDYFMMQCYKKLKKDASYLIANIFLNSLETILDIRNVNLYELSEEEYQEKLDGFISILEVMYITVVPKHSPDGEIMEALK